MATRSATRLWAIPPGDDGTIRRARRRRALSRFLAATGAFFISVAAFTYPLMKESTAVSGGDVLAEFRATNATTQAATGDRGAAASDQDGTKRKVVKKAGVAAEASRPASPSGSRTAAAASPLAPSPAAGEGGGRSASTAAPEEQNQQPGESGELASEGVYTWTVDGYEQAPGVRRDLPREAHRVLTHKSDQRWEEHMIFSKQKEMWFDLSVDDTGVVTNSSRNKVTIGPVTNDKTVVFDPPMMVSNWPFKVGETWSGRWDGNSSGTYEAKTFEHGWITIEGERVEVYASEVRMQMTGDIEGRVLTRSWVSPKYNIVVRQYMETDVRSGPSNYYSEWMGTVQSLTPQT